ncbi:MAG: ribosome assembly factor SBDS [Candidatus Bathyarchaeia archaeon]
MGEKHTVARLAVAGEQFEILVKPDPALDFKQGRQIDISKVLVTDIVFTDSSKGLRASEEKLRKAFGTSDALKVSETILRRGELQLTVAQRHRLVEEKRKQIVNFISRNCIDPRTNYPHPPLRIEQALAQIRVVIDPFKSGEEQAREVIEALRTILPLRIENMRIAVKIPPEHAHKAIGVVREMGNIKNEEWQNDGSWIAVVEIPAGLHAPLLERLGKTTLGNYQTRILK